MIQGVRPRSLVASFAAVAFALAVPLFVLLAVAAAWYVGSERDRLISAAHLTGDHLRARVDRDLAEMSAVARTLATSPLIDSGDFARFDAQARGLIAVDELTVTLADLDGRHLVDTRVAPGQPLPVVNRPAIQNAVLDKKSPVVSGLLISAVTGRRIISVSAPVIRDGIVTKIVSVLVRVEHFDRLIANEGLAMPYSAAIVDADGQVVALTSGAQVTDAKVAALREQTGHVPAASAPAPDIVEFRDASTVSGWTIVSGIETAALERPLWASLVVLGGLGFVLIGAGALVAVRYARIAAAAAGRLAVAADMIGRGETPTLPSSGIREADIVADAMTSASARLAEQRATIEAAQARLEARVVERNRELEASRAHYRALAESVSDVIVLRCQGSYEIAYVSPSSAQMFGYEPEEIRTVGTFDNVHPDDVAAVRGVEAALAAGRQGVKCLFRTRRRDGHWIWVESLTNRIASAGPGEPDVVSVMRDVTERQSDAEEQRIARDLAELAQAKAENANRAKSEFLGVVSHEIRTPLATIKGFSDLLSETAPLTAEQTRYIALVTDATAAMLTAIDDILDFAKVESGELHLAARPFQLTRALDAVTAFARPAAAHKGIILGVSTEPALPKFVCGDERRVRQVVQNVLNAVLRSRHGGVVTISAGRDHGRKGSEAIAIAIVASGGRGLAHQACGIGLSVSQRLVSLMGGRLEQAVGAGEPSCYRFTLVLPAAEEAAALDTPEAPRPRSRPGRLLIAEDHAINQEIARTILERAGHVVDVVADGADAVAAVQDAAYDLVLMDVQMPGLDGLTATRRIRALAHPSRRVPIIALTANVLPDQVRAIQEAGMNGHLAKPFERAALLGAVDAQLSSVVLVEPGETEAPPTIFDRAAYDRFAGSLGPDAARTALRGFVGLLASAHSDAQAMMAESESVAAGARRLGFLDLAAAHDRLAASQGGGDERAALDRCRIARDLAHRVLDELDAEGRGDPERVAFL